MKISIITVCLNSERFLESTIESVLSQDYNDIEYIIIDGNSTDKTIEIIKKFGSRINRFVSEPDKGIFDAMNKGLKMATGDIVGILNSDDLYINSNILSTVAECFKTHQCDIVYGDLYYVKQDNTDKIVRKWKTSLFIPGSFKKGWHPPHPAFFVKNDVYKKSGNFNLKYNLAADFEIMLRFLEKDKRSSYYLPQYLVKMRLGGASNKNFKTIIQQNIKCYMAFKNNGLKISVLYPIYRLIPKLFQFFSKK